MLSQSFAIVSLVAIFGCSNYLKLAEAKSTNEIHTIGPCVNGKCPEKFFCDSDYSCYPDGWKPLGKIIGRCVNNLCPAKHICQMDYCVQQAKEVASASPIGPCINKLCPSGYVCRNNGCYLG